MDSQTPDMRVFAVQVVREDLDAEVVAGDGRAEVSAVTADGRAIDRLSTGHLRAVTGWNRW